MGYKFQYDKEVLHYEEAQLPLGKIGSTKRLSKSRFISDFGIVYRIKGVSIATARNVTADDPIHGELYFPNSKQLIYFD